MLGTKQDVQELALFDVQLEQLGSQAIQFLFCKKYYYGQVKHNPFASQV
jgi:hypothetical protein